MYIKIHESYRNVVALCDKELIGKKFEEENCQLDMRESFFKGREIEEKEAIKEIKKQFVKNATFNIVGKKAIKTALSAGLIQEEDVGEINNIPFVLVLL